MVVSTGYQGGGMKRCRSLMQAGSRARGSGQTMRMELRPPLVGRREPLGGLGLLGTGWGMKT